MVTALEIPLENLSNRVVSAYHIRRMRAILEIALQDRTQKINYGKIAETISKMPEFSGIFPKTVRGLLSRVFRKEKILAGKSPKELQEEFLKANPKYLIPEKIVLAIELLKEPGASVNGVAKKMGIAGSTLIAALKQSGFYRKPTPAERGLRVLQGRGQKPEDLSYNRYYSLETVQKVVLVLKRNNGNKEKTIKELGRIRLIRVKKDAVDILLKILETKIAKNQYIKNKELYLRIAKEILLGRSAIFIAYTYKVSELAVIGVRRRLLVHFDLSEPQTAKSKRGILIDLLLNQTNFYNTFVPEWTSKRLWQITKKEDDRKTRLQEGSVEDNFVQTIDVKPKEGTLKTKLTKKTIRLGWFKRKPLI